MIRYISLKNRLILTVVAVCAMMTSCSSVLIRKPISLVVAKDQPSMYTFTPPNSIGDKIGVLENKEGESLAALGYRARAHLAERDYFILNRKGQEVLVQEGEVITEYTNSLNKQEPIFMLPKEKEKAAWDRVTLYLTRNNYKLKFDNSLGEERMETVPVKKEDKYYTFIRRAKIKSNGETIANGAAEFEVRSSFDLMDGMTFSKAARWFAHFLATGLQTDPAKEETTSESK